MAKYIQIPFDSSSEEHSKKMFMEHMTPLVESVVMKALREELNYDDDDDYYDDYDDDNEEDEGYDRLSWESYKSGYGDDWIDPSTLTKQDLINYCRRNDFYYILPHNRYGREVGCANAPHINDEICNDIVECGYVDVSHDADDILHYAHPELFEMGYIAIFGLYDLPDQDTYYIVYFD